MTQTANSAINPNRNLRMTNPGNYLFLNRKKDKDCDNCGKKITKRKRVVSRLVIEDKHHAIISFVCRRCS